MAFNLNLNFGPQWESVSIIRNFITEMLSTGIMDTNDAKKVATAGSELIENVVKYSAAGGAAIDIEKNLKIGKIIFTIRNIASPENIKKFKAVYETVIDGDPKEVYKAMMLRSFSDPETSQLGLARIRYECEGKLLYEISDDFDVLENIPASEDLKSGLKLLSVTAEIPVKLLTD